MISFLLLVTASMPWLTDAQFDRAFSGFKACFVLRDLGTGETRRYNARVAAERLSPCSTFKIPNSLIGLETGVAPDERHTYKWDGVKHPNRPQWDKDQTMASALRDSVVWYYVRLARDIGDTRMKAWVSRIGYGNRNTSSGWKGPFWLDSTMKISADEQVDFLSKLLGGKLPFSRRNVKILEKISVADSGPNWTLNGKTGSGQAKGSQPLGWYVGWVTKGAKRYVFATNIRGPRDAWGIRAREISRSVLSRMGLIGSR